MQILKIIFLNYISSHVTLKFYMAKLIAFLFCFLSKLASEAKYYLWLSPFFFFLWNDGKYKELTYNTLHYYLTEIFI